jgi:hypothetical protein
MILLEIDSHARDFLIYLLKNKYLLKIGSYFTSGLSKADNPKTENENALFYILNGKTPIQINCKIEK